MASHFEGTEKRIEIKYRLTGENDLFSLSLDDIKSRVLRLISCAVLDVMVLDDMKAILLSESSLFIFRDKIMIKTCGLTTLLSGVPALMELVEEVVGEMHVDHVLYTRRNYAFPAEQHTPHSSWETEVKFMRKMFPDGITKTVEGIDDTFHVFFDDRRDDASGYHINFTEVAMRNLDRDVMQLFFKKEGLPLEDYMEESGLSSTMPDDLQHDGFIFEPCGYSSNSAKDTTYYTIHITPEDSFSYVSLETNCELIDRHALYDKVTGYFKPGEAGLSLIADTCLLDNTKFTLIPLSSTVSMAFSEETITRRS